MSLAGPRELHHTVSLQVRCRSNVKPALPFLALGAGVLVGFDDGDTVVSALLVGWFVEGNNLRAHIIVHKDIGKAATGPDACFDVIMSIGAWRVNLHPCTTPDVGEELERVMRNYLLAFAVPEPAAETDAQPATATDVDAEPAAAAVATASAVRTGRRNPARRRRVTAARKAAAPTGRGARGTGHAARGGRGRVGRVGGGGAKNPVLKRAAKNPVKGRVKAAAKATKTSPSRAHAAELETLRAQVRQEQRAKRKVQEELASTTKKSRKAATDAARRGADRPPPQPAPSGPRPSPAHDLPVGHTHLADYGAAGPHMQRRHCQQHHQQHYQHYQHHQHHGQHYGQQPDLVGSQQLALQSILAQAQSARQDARQDHAQLQATALSTRADARQDHAQLLAGQQQTAQTFLAVAQSNRADSRQDHAQLLAGQQNLFAGQQQGAQTFLAVAQSNRAASQQEHMHILAGQQQIMQMMHAQNQMDVHPQAEGDAS